MAATPSPLSLVVEVSLPPFQPFPLDERHRALLRVVRILDRTSWAFSLPLPIALVASSVRVLAAFADPGEVGGQAYTWSPTMVDRLPDD